MDFLFQKCLVQKRDQLFAQSYRLDYRMEEIKYINSIIQKDIRTEYGGILQRLKAVEGHKLALLQHEMSNLQLNSELINEILTSFIADTKKDVNPLRFMVKLGIMKANIDQIMTKPFRKDIEVFPNDMPRELMEFREKVEGCRKQEALVSMKDQVIWNLVSQKKNIAKNAVKNLDGAASEEVKRWIELLKGWEEERKAYDQICYFCGDRLDGKNVNKKCKINQDHKLYMNFKGFTQRTPPNSFFGTKRHYWAPPDLDQYDG
jgi:hypothetical protein